MAPAPWLDAPVFTASWDGRTYQTTGPTTVELGARIDGAGDAAPGGIAGGWHWTGDRLEVRNDRYGHLPIFWTVRPGWIAVSPSIPALVHQGASVELDYAALAVFLRLGVFIQEDTPFSAIRALAPLALLQWDREGADVTGSLTLATPSSISREDALEEYIRLMRQSVARRLPEAGARAVVPLSGGADSRHILLELLRAEIERPWCPTARMAPPRTNHDAIAASRMAVDLDIDHELIDTFSSRFAAEVEKQWRTSFCSITEVSLMPLVRRLRPEHVVYDGLGGDVLSAGVLQTEALYRASQEGRWRDLANELVRPNEVLLRGLLGAEAYRRMPREPALERIADELARHADAANPLGSFMFFNENRRNLALRPLALLSGTGATVHTPYLDDDLVAFLSSLPARMTSRGLDGLTFHTEAIRLAHPTHPEWPYAYSITDIMRGVPDPLPPARDRHRFRRWNLALLRHVGRRRSALVDRSHLMPRFAAQAARGKQYLVRDLFAVYLVELERLMNGATGPRIPSNETAL